VTSQVQATREVRIRADGGFFVGRRCAAVRARISGSPRDGARSQASRRETDEAMRDLSGDHREPIDSKLCRDPNPPCRRPRRGPRLQREQSNREAQNAIRRLTFSGA